MDDQIDTKLDSISQEENIDGILITDKQGLCIKATGIAKEESSGLVTAISNLVAKLEPNESLPTVILESDASNCIIYTGKNTNSAVFKHNIK